MTTNSNFMTNDFAQQIYERYCRFMYVSQIPTLYDEHNNPVKARTLLVCYEEIGSNFYVNLKHLYMEDGETVKLTTFLVGRHTGKVQDRSAPITYDIVDRFNINTLLRNSKVSLINSSKHIVNYIKYNTDVFNNENIVHPNDDIMLKRKGTNKSFSFFTQAMYNSKLSNEPRFN